MISNTKSSVSTNCFFVTMAYPFPKVATAPQTPQHIQGIESPQINSNAHHEKLIMANKRLVLLTVLSLAFIVWLIDPFSHTVKGTDQIPFSPGLVDELDSYPSSVELGANHRCPVISIILRVIRIVASLHQISMFAHAIWMEMQYVHIHTVEIVLHYWKPRAEEVVMDLMFHFTP